MAKTLLDWDKIVIWDIETLCNCFIACFKDYKTGKRKEFIFYEHEDYASHPKKLLKFLDTLKKNNYTLLGFNSVGFDHQVIEYFIDNVKSFGDIGSLVDGIYSTAQEVISIPDDERFKVLIPESKLKHKAIDLFKQKHYDGKAKRGTSLKWLQFSMRYSNIEEMPYSHDKPITYEQISEVVDYCWNDIDSTEDFFTKIKYETELRVALSEEYSKNLLNASEPRLAKEIFGKFLCEEMDIEYSVLRQMKTIRKDIKFDDIIFPYVSFYTESFKKILDDFRSVKVDASPGSTDSFKYNFNYKNVSIDLGLGGIHGCIERGIYESDDEYMILDIDASSYYPNLAIQNDLKPKHLGDSFLKVYNNLYQERKLIDKKDPRNYIFKIVLNSCYGLSKEFNSYVYDPKFTYGITINGQLSLLMLTEMLGEYVKNLTLIQLNTDGITVKFKRSDYDRVMKICNQFEKVSKQMLEYAEYKKMVIMDVNNYLSVYENGAVKKKGLFETELDYHKNPSYSIVPKALSCRYIDNSNIEDYINNSTDMFDFCAGTKKKSTFALNYYEAKEGLLDIQEQQKVTRFYVAKEGGMLMKDFYDGRQVSVLAKQKIRPLNKMEDLDFHLNNIDRRWYIKQVEKLIAQIEHKDLLLKFE